MARMIKKYSDRALQILLDLRSSISVNLSDIPRYYYKLWFFITGYFSKWSFLFANSDFVLRVAPLKNKHKKNNKEYFPPPGYGVPLGKKTDSDPNHAHYGLFLWPGKLARDYLPFILLVNSFVVPPFIFYGFNLTNNNELVFCMFLALLSGVLFRFIFRQMPPVLTQVWKEWPESQYKQFLIVPHKIELTIRDKYRLDTPYSLVNSFVRGEDGKKKSPEIKRSLYWNPDTATPMRHQSSFYAADMKTLQEVLLHLAVFDFLFHDTDRSKDKSGSFKSIRVKNWLIYLLSPVWLSYFILLTFLLIYQFLKPAFDADGMLIFQYPYNFAWAVIFWFLLSSRFIAIRMNVLKKLEEDIHQGYYDTHLELVPQQILNAITRIPDEKQIRDGIAQMEKVLHTAQTAGLATLLMLLEIFSSVYATPS